MAAERDGTTGFRPAAPTLLEWIYLLVGGVLVFVYRWYMDDAFIYYRYIDNWLYLDAGLTYNLGEYVEGYSSPAFCLLAAGLRALGATYGGLVVGVGLVSWAAFWYLGVCVNRELRDDAPGAPRLNVPLAFLSANYAVTSFFTSGLEAPIAQLAAAVAALQFLRCRSRALGLALAAAPLVRPELALVVAVGVARTWFADRRAAVRIVAASALLNGAWLAFRIAYYADLFPNTYYLKSGNDWIGGLHFLADFVFSYHVVPLVLAALVLIMLAARRSGDRPPGLAARAAMLTASAGLTTYVVKIGGGAMHYYYLWTAVPLAVFAFSGTVSWSLARLGWRRRPLVEAAAILAFLAFGFSSYHRTLARHPLGIYQYEPLEGKITDPMHFRAIRMLEPSEWGPKVTPETLAAIRPVLHQDGYRETSRKGWCQQLYLDMDVRSVHRYGLTDAFLARADVPERRKGHKPLLRVMAKDIVDMQKDAKAIDRGMFREAVERGTAPEWVVNNLDAIEIIEKKVYNRHDFAENLRLAFTFPGHLEVDLGQEDLDELREERIREDPRNPPMR